MIRPSQIELNISSSSQYAHAFIEGRCVATFQRKRVYSSEPDWRAFDTDGKLILTYEHAPNFFAVNRFKRDLAAYLNERDGMSQIAQASAESDYGQDLSRNGPIVPTPVTHADVERAFPNYAEHEEAALLESDERELFNLMAHCRAPDWKLFKALEIGACRDEAEIDERQDGTQIEACGYADAEFLTIYGIMRPQEDGIELREAITDCQNGQTALRVAVELMKRSGLPCQLAQRMTDSDDDLRKSAN